VEDGFPRWYTVAHKASESSRAPLPWAIQDRLRVQVALVALVAHERQPRQTPWVWFGADDIGCLNHLLHPYTRSLLGSVKTDEAKHGPRPRRRRLRLRLRLSAVPRFRIRYLLPPARLPRCWHGKRGRRGSCLRVYRMHRRDTAASSVLSSVPRLASYVDDAAPLSSLLALNTYTRNPSHENLHLCRRRRAGRSSSRPL
jgi:hypothetical protein